jgi:hypothetical protein
VNLSIKHLPHMERRWLLKREHGEYSQHAHFYTKKEATICRTLIDCNKYPIQKKYQIAMKRILTKEEYKNLNKKDYYYKNVQNGRRENGKNIYK